MGQARCKLAQEDIPVGGSRQLCSTCKGVIGLGLF